MNTFLILYSTLPSDITVKWNNFVTNAFSKIVNTFTHKEAVVIPMTELSTGFSNEESYKYNFIPGYEVYEIPLGSAKQIESSYAPADTTDNSIQYFAEQNIVSLNQSGAKVSVVGMKLGETIIHAKNSTSGLEKTCKVKVVETVEPTSFEVTLDKTEIAIGEQQTLNINIDGGNLGHSELINFRYYDIRKLVFSSSNVAVATVDKNGVIYPQNVGNATISVSNSNGFTKYVDISIKSGTPVPNYENLSIFGSNVCYDNDMIRDQNSGTNHYQLGVKTNDTELNPEDFVWESSNELLVRVDKHGVVRGFRKNKVDDEIATITATSKLTGQSVSFEICVREQLPTAMYHSIVNGDKTSWNPTDYTTCVGDNLVVNIAYEPNISNKNIQYTITDATLIDVTNHGTSLSLIIKAEGACELTVISIVNPSLSRTMHFDILKAGAISSNEVEDIGTTIRKIVGHATLFAIAEAFTLIALYMFLYEKKHWIGLVLSLALELLISSISELVQHFSPDRHGTFSDIGINFLGSLFGAGILVAIYFIRKAIIKRKEKNND